MRHTASRHRYIDSTKKDECALCGRRRVAHLDQLSTSRPRPSADNASETGVDLDGHQAAEILT